jgi:tetratricopeptide (TPR) repeat protein
MSTIQDVFTQAWQFHQAGQVQEAERRYRQILQGAPADSTVWYLLGSACQTQGKLDDAVLCYEEALRWRPEFVEVLTNLGLVYRFQGRAGEAMACYRKALAINPAFSAAHNNLGLTLLDERKWAEAAARFQEAVRLDPNNAEARYNLGTALEEQRKLLGVDSQAAAYYEQAVQSFDQGRLDDAVAALQQALRVQPDYAEAYSKLGSTYFRQGRHDEAAASYRQAIAIKPASSAFHRDLGSVLVAQGKFQEAEAVCREAVGLQPADPGSHNTLGTALAGQRNLVKAAESFREALRLEPKFHPALHNLGRVLATQFRRTQAIERYREAIRLAPDVAEYHLSLGRAFHVQGKPEEAVKCYRRALELKPDYADAQADLAVVLTLLGKPEEAAACMQEALRLKPHFPEAYCNLGEAQAEMGDFAGAEASHRQAARLDPFYTALVAFVLGGRLPDADLEILRQQIQSVPADKNEPTVYALHARLAQVYDARKDYAQAAKHAAQANAIDKIIRRGHGQAYDPDSDARSADQAIATYTPEFFVSGQGWGLESEVPVFVFGLARSGTTLVEQILASHSQVHGAGEIGSNRRVMEQLQAMGGSIERDGLRRLAESCLEELQAHDPSAARVVDKTPGNYRCLGLLAMLFPRARFIHCRRDLRDVAVSCWLTSFKQVNWANDQESIAFIFGQYRRLMAHWQQVLPAPILEVSYETLVANLETEARRLVAFCGLEWEPACLSFHQTRRAVRTASFGQVRQPIYSRSVGRWRHYKDALAPLFAQLEALGPT